MRQCSYGCGCGLREIFLEEGEGVVRDLFNKVMWFVWVEEKGRATIRDRLLGGRRSLQFHLGRVKAITVTFSNNISSAFLLRRTRTILKGGTITIAVGLGSFPFHR